MASTDALESAETLRDQVVRGDTVDQAEIATLVLSDDSDLRAIGLHVRVLLDMRSAVGHAGKLAKIEKYSRQFTIDVVQNVGQLCGEIRPFVEACKQIGLQAAQQDDVNRALTHFQLCVDRAGINGERRSPLTAGLTGYLHDSEIDQSLAHLGAKYVNALSWKPRVPVAKVAILVSALIDNNAPSMVSYSYARGLKDLGLDVTVVSTEYGKSEQAQIFARHKNEGIPVLRLAEGAFLDRTVAATSWFHQQEFDAVLWVVTPMDILARFLGCTRIAPIQVFANIAGEPFAGEYDALLARGSKEQEIATIWPGRTHFTGNFVTIGSEIDLAKPYDRQTFSLDQTALIVGTFGRIEKCLARPYVDGILNILESVPESVLFLVGPGRKEDVESLQDIFAKRGVLKRVQFFGSRQSDLPSLYKNLDLYCDNSGGQSVIEAMWAGLPIVAWSGPIDDMLQFLVPKMAKEKPLGAQMYLGSSDWVADPKVPSSYSDLAVTLLRNGNLRAKVGESNAAMAHVRHNPKNSMSQLHDLVNSISRKLH